MQHLCVCWPLRTGSWRWRRWAGHCGRPLLPNHQTLRQQLTHHRHPHQLACMPPAHTNTHITEKLWILALTIPKCTNLCFLNDCKLLRSTGSINQPTTIILPLQCLDKIVLKYSFHYHQTQCLSFMPERSTLASALIHQQHIHPTVVLVTLESETDSNVLLKTMLFFFLNYLFGRNLDFVLGSVSKRIHVFHKK